MAIGALLPPETAKPKGTQDSACPNGRLSSPPIHPTS